jgi:hypothetical protein
MGETAAELFSFFFFAFPPFPLWLWAFLASPFWRAGSQSRNPAVPSQQQQVP